MEKVDFVFQTDSEIIAEAYTQNPNYLIEFSAETEPDDQYCILYFSSNDIYYPNNVETFRAQILNKNKFEWYQTRIKKGKKHIFLRDIKKQWYLTGINHEINTIEKLAEFLRKETGGYKIIALGSSAGGFAAVLLGSMLNAETLYTFNGQFMLNDLILRSSEMIDPIIFREQENPEINTYYSLKAHIRKPERIYYFYSNSSKLDVPNFEHIKDLDINFIPFRTSHHGIPFLKTNLNRLLNFPIGEIQGFVGKVNHPLFFSLKIDGLFKTMKDIIVMGLKLISRKILTQKLS